MNAALAIVWVRGRLLINSLRRKSSGWELVATILSTLGAIGLSLGIAFGVGAACWSAAEGGADLERLRFGHLVAFWGCTFLGVLMPILLSAGPTGVDVSRLQCFPIPRPQLVLCAWGSAFFGADHLFWYPTLAAALGVSAVVGGGLGILELAFFAAVPLFVVTWSTGLVGSLQLLLRSRRGKEVAGLLGITLLVLGSLVPLLLGDDLEEATGSTRAELFGSLEGLVALASFTPPGLAADGLAAARAGDAFGAWRALLDLGLWIGLGGAFTYGVLAGALRSAGGRGGRAAGPALERRARRLDVTRLLPFLAPEVLAVASKELRYLLRSSVGKFNLIMLPVLCVIFATALDLGSGEGSWLGSSTRELSLYGLLMYALLFTNNFVSNCAGWEGVGFKVYLLAPVPFPRVLLGKNLGVWTFASLLYAEVLVFWCFYHGPPAPGVWLGSASLFIGALAAFTTAGNFASLAFPVARDSSAMKSQPSQPAVLLSTVTVLALAGVVVFLLAVPYSLGISVDPHLLLPLFALGALAVHRLSLRYAGELFERKREHILAALEAGP